ncbi:MAG TPA: spore germination protein [Clostridia bacterium]|nr:spore germination protein [Clostridia bacterium]
MKRLISIKRKVKPQKYKTIKQIATTARLRPDNSGKAAAPALDAEEWFRRELAGNGDIVFRDLMIGGSEDLEAVLIYTYGSIDKNTLNVNIIKPLMNFKDKAGKDSGSSSFVKRLMDSCLTVGTIKALKDKNLAKDEMFQGRVILLLNNIDQIIILEVAGVKARQVTEPENERTLRGSKEGFIEDLWNNVAVIRKTLPDPTLKVEVSKVGRRTKTDLAVLYVGGLADAKLVKEVKSRIKKIDIDGVLANGYIEAFIEDNPYSPFPQTQGTEKPDKVVAALLEGRIAVVLDRTPYVLLVPAQLIQFFQAPEDYYERTYIGTYIRILRAIAFLVTTSAAPAYIALTSFHPELVPLELLLNIAELRKKVPFPPVIEALIMEFVIESLREAGLRLPTAVATTLGVVGGIILGDAAVRSNLVSPAMIIVITITIICNFIIPNYSMSLVIRLLRLFLILAAASFGAFGITLGWLIIIIHLCSLESFGVPYFAPIAPTRFKDLKDLYIRVPIWAMKERPVSIPGYNKKRVVNAREQKDGK